MLMNLDYIVMQFFQPYFYYSTTLMIVSFVCVRLIAKYNPILTARARSILYLIPLAIPILLAVIIGPWLMRMFLIKEKILFYGRWNTQLIPSRDFTVNPTVPAILRMERLNSTMSLSNLLYMIGFILSLTYLIITLTLGDRIVRRVFHVIELDQKEYESLQKRIGELAVRMGMDKPKIGLVEDLRPNAFVTGYGRKTMLVFSLGLLNTLTDEELTAVAAHELSHVKNHDFIFKASATALSLVSFFNPFAHFSSASAQREREILADEYGVKILGKPRLFEKALVKISKAAIAPPGEGFTARLASSLFLASPLSMKTLFSTHPRLEYRIKNVEERSRRGSVDKASVAFSITLSIAVILIGVLSTCLLASIQTSFMRQHIPWVFSRMPFPRVFVVKPGFNETRSISIPNYLKRAESSFNSRVVRETVEILSKSVSRWESDSHFSPGFS